MSDPSISEEVIEAATVALAHTDAWETVECARAALRAAVPLIERQLREKIAAEIEAERLLDDTGDPGDVGYNGAIRDAARVARGETT